MKGEKRQRGRRRDDEDVERKEAGGATERRSKIDGKTVRWRDMEMERQSQVV